MTRRRPILLMVRELGIGGCERDLTKIAVGIDRSRFEPHVATFRPKGLRRAELEQAGVPILHLDVPSFMSRSAISAAWHMGMYIRRHRIQLVHALDVSTDLFGVPVAWLFRVPGIISSQLSYRDNLYSRLEHLLLPVTDRMSDRVLVNSNAVKEHLVGLGVRRELLYLAHNGVDTRVFHPEPGQSRRAFEDDASLVIGTVCALRPEKRLDTLIAAFAKVHELKPGLRLIIVGSGGELPKLQELSERLGIRSQCHFEPALPEVADWMRSIDVFVLTSTVESFPNALLEAMACGCAPVGSAVGGVPELISHNSNGLLFESGNVSELVDRLTTLIQNREMLRELGRRACHTAQAQFSIEHHLRRIEGLYESLP